MIGLGWRAAAVALVLSFAALPARPAAAADFVDQCMEGGGGMFVKEECVCLDDSLEDDDRDDLVAFLKAALSARKTGKELEPDASVVKNGVAVLNKYEKQCSKNSKK